MKKSRFWILLLGLILAGHAHCETLFKWTDSNGKVHYSASIPPDAVKGSYEKMDKTLGKKILSERELSQEEVKAQEAQKRKDEETKRIEKELAAKRQALLQRFRSESEFDTEIAKIEDDYRMFIEKTETEISNFKKQLSTVSQSANPDKVELARLRKEIEDRKVFIERRRSDKEQRIEKIIFEKKEWLEAKKS